MTAQFFDRQDGTNPINGQTITNASELRSILSGVRHRPPFFLELIGDNGFKLLLGISATEGCAQFSSADGDAPYFMAVSDGSTSDGEVSFLIDDTASPVPRRFCLPYEAVVEIAETFIHTGQRKADMEWEEI